MTCQNVRAQVVSSRKDVLHLSIVSGTAVGEKTGGGIMATNPRYKNGNLRRKYRARMKAQGCACGICHGRLGPIHYDEPSDAKHPLSFVIDEIRPVAHWKQNGYRSPEEAAQDWSNLQAAHYICNSLKSSKENFSLSVGTDRKAFAPDGEW